MAFPTDPLDVRTELFLSGNWIDVSGDVMVAQGVQISKPRANESSKLATAAQCRFRLRNDNQQYDPDYAGSPYYGVLGRNTPVRVGVRTARSTFSRTNANGWAQTDTGQTWLHAWNGGNGLPDFPENGGKGHHILTGAGQYRMSWLAGFQQRDVDIAATVHVPVTTVTGANLEPLNLLMRFADLGNYIMLRALVSPTGEYRIGVRYVKAGAETNLLTDLGTGITLAPTTQDVRMRVLLEGQQVRFKAWVAGTPEPYDWLGYVQSEAMPQAAGSVGIRSGVAGGNTNVPVTFDYDDLDVRSPRFFGEIASITPRNDRSDHNRWADVEAAGVFRRLQQGATPVLSTLKRAYLQAETNAPVAYWPCEDGREATSAASAIDGVDPMQITQGKINFASNGEFACSADMLALNNGTLWGVVPSYPSGAGMVRFLVSFPATGLADGEALATIHTSGDISRWRLTWHTGGALKLMWFDRAVVYVGDSGAIGFNMVDKNVLLQIDLSQQGGNIRWRIATLEPGAGVGLTGGPGTVNGRTLGRVTDVYIGPDMDVAGVGIGHVAVQPAVTDLFDFAQQLAAYNGEEAYTRAGRLSVENGFYLGSYRGAFGQTEVWTKLGPQRPKVFLDLLEDVARADNGVFYENRGSIDGTYRTYPSLLHQDVRIAFDYTAGQLSDVPAPVNDDQALVNDFTATRTNGSSYRLTKTTGRLSTKPPQEGGVGTYDASEEFNVWVDSIAKDIAAWRLHLGTDESPRYPTVSINLANPRVAANTTLCAQVRDANIADRITIANFKPDLIDLLILGYTETLKPFEHSFTFNCRPGAAWDTATVGGVGVKADATNSTLATAITATATTFTVVTAAGSARWIDSATYGAEFPIRIKVGGEEMRVTAISGTTNTQTFTVIRSVNGITKSHAAGAAVQLARPAIVAGGVKV
ncbi:hypothetical protein [Amycolatopsis methanolica]|nr:hypothetical protein [Amycolatopsis methanolica]